MAEQFPGAPPPSLAQRLDRALARIGTTVLIPLVILAIAWTQELLDQVLFGGRWNLPMVRGGSLLGVFTAPFSHSGLPHLISNSLWFLPLSWLVLLHGRGAYLLVWVSVMVTAIPVWLLWPGGSHGLSGVVYGLLGYLVSVGWLHRRLGALLLSILALLTYGALLPGLLPFLTPARVSWIGHLSGFLGGVLAAWLLQPEDRGR
ncbi:MAG: rhomboid family intramembrane serine protease [Synechococcaceae cyanobacterium]